MPLPPLSSIVDPALLATRPEADRYYAAHASRYLRALDLIRERVRFSACLDIGAGPQTRLLAREYPAARIDTLGTYHETLYAPDTNSEHVTFDLHECADPDHWPAREARYDLIVFMEVLEHLFVSPQRVFEFLHSMLRPGGAILCTTPNAARLGNRLLWARGVSPFHLPRPDGREHDHVREYTTAELREVAAPAGLTVEFHAVENLYAFSGWKNRALSALAGVLPASFRGIHVYLLRRTP